MNDSNNDDAWLETAAWLLDSDEYTSDAHLVAGLLGGRDREEVVALISEDRRLRAVAEGLGVTVTSTFGMVVRASLKDKYFQRHRPTASFAAPIVTGSR